MARSPTAFTLRSDGRVGYSPAERRVFGHLCLERLTSEEISRLHYGRNMPYNGRRIVIGLLRSLVRKTRHNREPFRIGHTDRAGPHSMSFWLMEKRQ